MAGIGQELRFVPAGSLELAIEATQFLAGSIDIGGQRAELVAVGHMDALVEITGSDLAKARLDFLNRLDQGPRDQIAKAESQKDAAEREGRDQYLRGSVG